MRRNLSGLLAFPLLAIALLSGCAVQKSQAPQIAPATADALNLGTMVSNAQNDYLIFFQTVGQLERQGALSSSQVATLNTVGDKIEVILNSAGSLCQTYAQTNSLPIEQQIEADLAAAAADYATIYQEKATMLAQNSAAKNAAPASKPQ